MVDLVNVTGENITVRNSVGDELFNTDHRYLMYTDVSTVSTSGLQRTPIIMSSGDQSSLDLLKNYAGYENADSVLTQLTYANKSGLPSPTSSVAMGTFQGPFPSLPAVFFHQPSTGATSTISRSTTTRTLTLQDGTVYGTYRWVVSKVIAGPGTDYNMVFPEVVSLTGVTPGQADVLTMLFYSDDVYSLMSNTGYVNIQALPLWYDYPHQVLTLGVTE